MLIKYGKYPILKIGKISYILELENMGYISHYISPIYIVPTLVSVTMWLFVPVD